MPDPIPSETGNLGEASVMVLLGTDLAGKPLPGAVPTATKRRRESGMRLWSIYVRRLLETGGRYSPFWRGAEAPVGGRTGAGD